VVGVSYFLKEIFARVKKVKFIVVITETGLHDPQGKVIAETFGEFINMFHIDKMTPEMKEEFKASLSMLVTRSINHTDYYDYLEAVRDKLGDPKLNVPHKQLIAEFVDHIRENDRVQFFKAAVKNANP
jgi:hypothetical protein